MTSLPAATDDAGAAEITSPEHDETAFDPAAALRPGTADAVAVWALHIARKSALPLAFIGAIVLAITHHKDRSLSDLDTTGDWIGALWSPLVFLILAVTVRLLSSWIGLLAAYPLSHRARAITAAHRGRGSAFGRWIDRLHLARAYRAIRRTKPVRDVAALRLGASRRWWLLAERVVSWSLPALIVVSLLTTAIASPNT